MKLTKLFAVMTLTLAACAMEPLDDDDEDLGDEDVGQVEEAHTAGCSAAQKKSAAATCKQKKKTLAHCHVSKGKAVPTCK